MTIIRDGTCPFIWNPGDWPFATRCVSAPGHDGDHVDMKGRSHGPQVAAQAGDGRAVVRALVECLTVPSHLGSAMHRDKLQQLAMQWPTLAALLGALVAAHGDAVPAPLRRALSTLQSEGVRRG